MSVEAKKNEDDKELGLIGTTTGVGDTITPVTQPAQTGMGTSPFSNKQSTSPAANLRRYIDANQTNIGQNVAQNVEKDVEKAEGKFGNVKSTFEQNKSNLENLYNNQANQFQQQLGQQQYQPILDNENQFQTFQQLRDRDLSSINQFQDQYQTNLQELNPVQQRASERVQQFGNEQGRFKLLQNMFNKPGYSAGQQSLDQLLMQTDPSLRNLSTNLTRRDQTLQSGLSNLDQQFQEANPTFRNRATEVQEQLTQGLLGGETTLSDMLGNRVQERITEEDAQINRLQDLLPKIGQKVGQFQDPNQVRALGGPMLEQQDLDYMRFGVDDLNQLSIDPNMDFRQNYITQSQDFGVKDVAEESDINRYNALKQLAGSNIASQFNLDLQDNFGDYEQKDRAFQLNQDLLRGDMEGAYRNVLSDVRSRNNPLGQIPAELDKSAGYFRPGTYGDYTPDELYQTLTRLTDDPRYGYLPPEARQRELQNMQELKDYYEQNFENQYSLKNIFNRTNQTGE